MSFIVDIECPICFSLSVADYWSCVVSEEQSRRPDKLKKHIEHSNRQYPEAHNLARPYSIRYIAGEDTAIKEICRSAESAGEY